MKKILAVLMAALMIAVCMPVFAIPDIDIPERDPHGIGADLSAVNAPYLLQGGQLSTTDFFTMDDIAAHTITVINFWSQNCTYCLPEMPYFQQLHDNYSDRVLVVGCGSLLISGSAAGEANHYFSNGYTYMSVFQDSVLKNYHEANGYLPQTIIVNSEGIVVDLIEGAVSNYEELLEKVGQWLGYYSDEYYDVTFVNNVNDDIIDVQTVHAGYKPTYPTPPVIPGYTFAYWDPATPPTILGPTTIVAHYNIKSYRVRFYDSLTGDKLKTEYVQYGHSATAPEPPVHEGYEFIGWDRDYSNITDNIDVYALYSSGELTPGDADGNGDVDSADALLVLRYSMNLAEIAPALMPMCDVNGDGDVNSGDAVLILRAAMNLR